MEQPSVTKPVRFIFLLSAYIGTIFGVGIYGLPYVVSRAGIFVFLGFLLFIGFLVYLVNIVYADVVSRENDDQRFVGYIREYVGNRAAHAYLWINIASYWGTLLVYLLVWGKFAQLIISPGGKIPEIVFSLLLFLITAIIIFRGSKTVVRFDTIFLVGVIALFAIFAVIGAQHVGEIPTRIVNASSAILPYGTILFALWGVSIIPEIVNHTRQKLANVKKVVLVGLIFAAILYVAFALFVASISGPDTTKEAFSGLEPFLGRTAIIIGACIGVITIFLSYINLGWSARNMLHFDMKLNRAQALALLLLPPLVLRIAGLDNLVVITSVIGAIFLGLNGMMIFYLYFKSKFHMNHGTLLLKRPVSKSLIITGIILFSIGVCIECVSVLIEVFNK
ncbi:MAG: amino acid permease [Patescibacteria group bacterium]|jgi:amino acid permease